jgi:hypothetical protein
MHGIGRFFDPRLNDPTRFPLAVKNKLFDVQRDPDSDRISSKLAAPHVCQLSIPSPKPAIMASAQGAANRWTVQRQSDMQHLPG